MLELLLKLFFYWHVGWVIEIWFTSVHNLIFEKDIRAPGRTYLWMLPIYGLGGVLLGALRSWIGSPWLFIPAMVLFIYLAEASAGLLLKKTTGKIPWDYGSARFGIAGLVRLDYAPWWTLVAVCFDFLSNGLDKIFRFVGTLG